MMIKSRKQCVILYFWGFSVLCSVIIHFILICVDLSSIRITDTFIHTETFFGWVPLILLFGYWFFRILFDRHDSGRQILFYLLTLLISAYSALFISGWIAPTLSAGFWISEIVGCVIVILFWTLSKLDAPKKIRFIIFTITGISYSLVYSFCIHTMDSASSFWPITILYGIIAAVLIGNDLYSSCWPLPRVRA